jgi:hypothetical protein
MQFRLTYEGPLYSSQSKQKKREHVQEIRRKIHSQMRDLWNQLPLSNEGYQAWWLKESRHKTVDTSEMRGSFWFVPLITSKTHLLARLDILLLRPAPPGHLVGHGGDLDNRLKTFLDALRIPDLSELPEGDAPQDGEAPFMCLLSDDKLVTSISLEVDRLLRPSATEHDVLIVAKVTIGAVFVTIGNGGLVSMGLAG